jgi:CO/xanthine dehydrogenase Mo-binding subunit
MNAPLPPHSLSRRALLASGGALIVSFSLAHAQDAPSPQPPATTPAAEPPKPAPLPGSLKEAPFLDSWIKIEADGGVTVFTGKVELGQGIKTALIQVAAEELDVDVRSVKIVTADTALTANEGYTAGSHSMQDSGTAIRHAAAQVRELLIGLGAERLNVPAERLQASQGAVIADDGRSVPFGQLVTGTVLHVQAQPQSKLKDPAKHAVVGKPVARIDIPAKVTGGVAYIQDMRLPNMVHARVVRPPSYGARLKSVDTSRVERMPGVLKVVRDGNYIAVIAEREYGAVQAMRALADDAVWDVPQNALPDPAKIYDTLLGLPAQTYPILNRGTPSTGAKAIEATYHRPYQMHASIGPSCAVALYEGDTLTVWAHSQGMFPLRKAVSEMVRMPPEQVRCIHVEGSGCYGHNGADDAGADAAYLAKAFPGRPVRVQWMREDEHSFEPYGPAMITNAKAALDGSGSIVDWEFHVWSNTHSMRPGTAGNLLAANYLGSPFTPPPPKPLPLPEGGGDRNAIPIYSLPNARVVHHFIPEMPIRVSAQRGLGAYMNIFSLESFMDELATAGGIDPVQFRLKHLEDPRARDVVTMAAERFGWLRGGRRPPGRGQGFAFARYKNLAAYCAVAVELDVERETGKIALRRVVAAVDSGEAVSPDGIRNQIEGGILQSSSWTLYEEVGFDRTRILSRDWSRYPILRFTSVPQSVEVFVIDRPGQPFLGTGEASQGPTGAAIANALADAAGVRIRDLPLARERVKAAIGT